MKNPLRYLLSGVLTLAFISAPMTGMVQPALAAAICVDSSPLSALYVVEVCITSPADGATFAGDGIITATVSYLSGVHPGVKQVVFSLDSTYLLTAFESPYSFTLPANRYVDGTYTLSAQALLQDGFSPTPVSISLVLQTGTLTPPVNTKTFAPTSGRPANGQPFVVATVGDGASGEAGAISVTTLIKNKNPNLFLYLGDVYEQGSIAEFYNWYGNAGSFFDQFRSITDPTIGHHEYLADVSGAPYFYYWDNIPNYYSFEANGWHIISLNSHGAAGGIKSAEYKWLQTDLAAHPATCTIAYYHNPLYSIGVEAPDPSMTSIWQLLAQNNVDIVLSGNDHDYERWKPMDGNGVLNSNGMTEFVIGTGGHALQTIVDSDPRVAFSESAASGVLLLTLNPTNAGFSFVNTSGTVLDSGTIPCQPVVPPPTFNLYLPLVEN